MDTRSHIQVGVIKNESNMKKIFKKGMFASIATLFHKIFPKGKITSSSIVSMATDFADCLNFARNVESDVSKVGNDPAKIAECLTASIKKNINEIPSDFLSGSNLDEVIEICSQVINLPLESIESAIKNELGIK